MHRTTEQFRHRRDALPQNVQEQAERAFALLKSNPKHPSLHFKKIGPFWSARVGQAYRALAVEDGEDFIWVWVGAHDEYVRILRERP
jgi:hypothetical protein